MIAAIYARLSKDKFVNKEAMSTTRQVEHARKFAADHGWTVADDFVFIDDDISGAEFAARPGFVKLMNTLKPRAPFSVLIMSESSRLGREQFETGFALKQLSQAGVRVWSYLDDEEIDLNSTISKFMMSAATFAAELERDRARQRVVDTMARKARAGHVCGGACFGYDNVAVVGPDGKRSHTARTINAAEAAVVRRIFEMSARGGVGFTRIAKALNADGAPCPRPVPGRPAGWAPTSVRSIVLRPIYRGEMIYNTTKKKDQWGQHKTTDRPEREWIRTPMPALRIVDDALWYTAQTRLDGIRTVLGTTGRRHRYRDADSAYLLSGFARCATCGGALCVTNKRAYTCAANHRCGARVCPTALRKRTAIVDEAVLAELDRHLRPRSVLRGLLDVVQDHRSPRARASSLDRTRAALHTVEREIANLTRAITVGGDLDSLVGELKAREARRRDLTAALAAAASDATPVDQKAIEQIVREHLDRWRHLLDLAQQRHVDKGRELFRAVFVGPLRFTAAEDDAYHFEGDLGLGRLLEGTAGGPVQLLWRARGESSKVALVRFSGIAA